LGNNADVVAKMSGAFDLAKAQGRVAALPLYYQLDPGQSFDRGYSVSARRLI
jgi:hypothetical protein